MNNNVLILSFSVLTAISTCWFVTQSTTFQSLSKLDGFFLTFVVLTRWILMILVMPWLLYSVTNGSRFSLIHWNIPISTRGTDAYYFLTGIDGFKIINHVYFYYVFSIMIIFSSWDYRLWFWVKCLILKASWCTLLYVKIETFTGTKNKRCNLCQVVLSFIQ